MREDPMLLFKFHVQVDQIIEGFFTECNGLNVEREIEAFKEGGVNHFEYKLPGRIKYGNVTLKRGMAVSNALWEWFHENHEHEENFFKVKRAAVTITQFNQSGQPIRRWTLKEAYPVKWQGPDFKADGSQVAVETLELAHHGIEQN